MNSSFKVTLDLYNYLKVFFPSDAIATTTPAIILAPTLSLSLSLSHFGCFLDQNRTLFISQGFLLKRGEISN